MLKNILDAISFIICIPAIIAVIAFEMIMIKWEYRDFDPDKHGSPYDELRVR